ncbi:hypothetical protein JCM25156A_03730 [Komagataeibacter kakiaceti JCM 25156]
MTDERRVPITLRMPRDLLDRLKAAADARSHSMNAEIIQRLEESFIPQNIDDIFALHSKPPPDLNYARVNVTLAHDALEHAQEMVDFAESDPSAGDLEKALSRYEVKRAQKHLDRCIAMLEILEAKK